MGIREFYNAILSDKLSPQSLLMYTYGQYLANGGTPEGFMELDEDDFEMMSAVMLATPEKHNRRRMDDLIKLVKAMFGEGD